MTLVQVQFVRPSNEDGSVIQKLVWVDKSWALKPNDSVSFKDNPDIEWNVFQVYGTIIEPEEINTRWGLGLPKSQRTER